MSKVEKEDLINKDFVIRLEDTIDILTTDDERLNIIGEELSNENGRAIFAKLFDGVHSVSEIASILNISIPLVRWHIMRLSQVGLVKVNDMKLSQKNKPVQYYEPTKFALVIIPSKVMKSSVYPELLKSTLKKIYRYLPVFVTLVVSTAAFYLLKTNNQPSGYSYDIRTFAGNQLLYINSDFAISLIGGALSAIIVLGLIKWHNKKRKT
ncbi:MAG: winged helix-turn-helix transcriptional regulator [Thaumarchaeota archaeon]|nr:winged helix-turn-helix transcriptional regulator [Nitrososphaerota archaeon]